MSIILGGGATVAGGDKGLHLKRELMRGAIHSDQANKLVLGRDGGLLGTRLWWQCGAGHNRHVSRSHGSSVCESNLMVLLFHLHVRVTKGVGSREKIGRVTYLRRHWVR